MNLRTVRGWLSALAIGGLFALGIWFRVSSLEGLPDIDGDEAWYGVQAYNIMHGRPFTVWTAHHNPVNPFHIGLVVLALLVHEPALWILRFPCLLAGLVAIPLTYALMKRILDQRTALIAAGLMATLPVSIVWSRTGYDGSQLLLFSLLALYAAFSAHRGGLLLASAICFLAHPTAIFLAPALVAVHLARSGAFDESVTSRVRMRRLAAGAVILMGVVGFGIVMLHRPNVRHLMSVYKLGYANHHDWFEFWGWFGRLFLVVGRAPQPHHDRAFWLVVLPVLVAGTWLLARRRRWDRLALVAGVVLSAAGMALVGGTTILQPGMTRYGLALVAPAAVAFACLLEELIGPAGVGRFPALKSAAIVVLGWALVLSFRMEALHHGHVTDGTISPRHDTIWTPGDHEPNPSRRALSLIVRDLRTERDGSLPHLLIAEDWATYMTLSYLTVGRKAVSVAFLGELATQPDFPAKFRVLMESRAYGVGAPGGAIESVIRGTFGADAVEVRAVPRYGQPALEIIRLRPIEAVASSRPDATPR